MIILTDEFVEKIKHGNLAVYGDYVISAITTSHISIEKDILNGKHSPIQNIKYLLCSVLSFILGFSRFRLSTGKNIGVGQKVIIYAANNKVAPEVGVISRALRENGIEIECLMNEPASFPQDQNLIRDLVIDARFLFRYVSDFIRAMYLFVSLFVVKKISVKELVVLSGALRYLKLKYAYLSFLSGASNSTRLINLFSATREGHILNKTAHQLSIPVITYSWGSNAPALEQKHTFQDRVWLKYSDERGKYAVGKEVVVGDIGLRSLSKSTQTLRWDICFIDSCEGELFLYPNKIEFYSDFFSALPEVSDLSIHICFHPGSKGTDGVVDCAKKYFKEVEFSTGDLHNNFQQSKLVVNVCSTEIKTIMVSRFAMINLAPLWFFKYYVGKIPEFFRHTSGLDLHSLCQLGEFHTFDKLYDRCYDEELAGPIIENLKGVGITNNGIYKALYED